MDEEEEKLIKEYSPLTVCDNFAHKRQSEETALFFYKENRFFALA